VTTTEGIGNTKDGYHPVQQRPSGFHGTPCMCMCICGRPFVLAPAVGCRRSTAVERGLPDDEVLGLAVPGHCGRPLFEFISYSFL
jgi:hypothetical protein